MKGLTKWLFCSLVICAAVFAGCGNPWMKRITASLYDKPVTPGIPEVPVIPVLTGMVSITGTPLEGEILTADTTSLDGSGTIGYQWGQGDALAGPFTDIVSATDTTYTLQTADNGKYIAVTVTRDGYSGSVTSPGLGPVGLPLLSGAVTVSGTAVIGQTLTAVTTLLDGTGAVSYQWQGGDAPAGPFTDIASAADTYTLTAADNGKYIVVMVTRAGYSGYVISSPAAGPVGLPPLTGTVTVSGTAVVDQTLTAVTTSLGGTSAISYQWGRGDALAGPFTDIASATADTYTLAAADDGKYIVVTVTRVDNSGSVTSSPTLVPASHPIAAWIADTIAAAVALDSGAGSDADHTISLPPPNINLSASGSYGWAGILAALASAGRYVELDLSACTMSSGTTFDPGAADTGERYITALIFPDTATIIAGSSNINAPTFRYFTALKSVSGAGIQTVGNFAFRSCTSLETMSFLTATHIDQHAFASCTALSTVELPEATHIGWNALAYGIFSTLSLPAVIDIQGYAFASCRALTTLNLPAVPPTLGGSAFISTSTGPMLTIQVPSGTVADYESDWGVLADTAVSGNEGRYGQFHKRIVITDTP